MATYKANSSRSRRLYCFLGFMVLKSGSLMTSGQTAGQGLPHRRLQEMTRGMQRWCQWWRKHEGCSRSYYLRCCVRGRAAYLMSSSCRSSWLAWKMGFFVKSSPKMHLSHNRQMVRNYILPIHICCRANQLPKRHLKHNVKNWMSDLCQTGLTNKSDCFWMKIH